jgi:hypothetical protein
MPTADAAFWSEQLRETLRRYDEALLRRVAGKLLKPRGQWPAEELIERGVATVSNAAVIDRRLEALEPAGRRVLALIGHSRQPRWRVGNLIELLAALGPEADVRPLLVLLESGLLAPALPGHVKRLKDFEQWLGASQGGPEVFAHPDVTARALTEDLGLPECPGATSARAEVVHEADGLEWPLRLAVLWQQIGAGPLRRTQHGDFFKRDFDRLRADPLLNGPPAEALVDLPDAGLLAVELSLVEGVLQESDGELRAAELPGVWNEGLAEALGSLLAALPQLELWNAREGWRGAPTAGNPYPSAYLLCLLLLARLPEGSWADPEGIGRWVVQHHPYWRAGLKPPSRSNEHSALSAFLLGLAYQLRLLQAAREGEGKWLVRLSPPGRRLLGLGEEAAAPPPAYLQTLMVQPNLEVVAYRQGLTPGLIARLSRFAAWKGLGAACTLQLQPDTVYRALESGQTFETILQTLEQHGMRPTPAAVVESLRTWANKRERLGVYPAATLFEFNTADDLNEALARGLPGVRLSERLAVVANEGTIDFRHFRLTGTRDYGLPPEMCIAVSDDGVTLSIDLARSDLLLETELKRFAERLDGSKGDGRRLYRLTPASLAAGRDSGLSVFTLEEWFLQRTGHALSPAARLLLGGAQLPPLEVRQQLVLHVETPEAADGLLQWPGTRGLIQQRLGPTALAIAAEHLDELSERLRGLGISVRS